MDAGRFVAMPVSKELPPGDSEVEFVASIELQLHQLIIQPGASDSFLQIRDLIADDNNLLCGPIPAAVFHPGNQVSLARMRPIPPGIIKLLVTNISSHPVLFLGGLIAISTKPSSFADIDSDELAEMARRFEAAKQG